jgi:N5-(cytidine 5'-diphosphoramidyl)-L-glutamine hydrolase
VTGARIGITQRVEVLADRDERRDALDQAWTTWIGAGGDLAVPIPNAGEDVVAFVRALELDAIVLTGGNDLAHLDGATNAAPERDATERALLTDATECGRPVLAVCRGMQMLVSFWGGTPSRVIGHVGVPHEIDSVFSPWRLRAGPVNSFHDWGIAADGVGAILEVLATAPDGTVESVAHRTLPQVGVMWHPERAVPDPADRELLADLVERAR